MAKGITYYLKDSTGAVHTRYSAGHTKCAYTFAVVRNPGTTHKGDVAFARAKYLADSELNQARKYYRNPEICLVGYREGRWSEAQIREREGW